MKTHLFLLSLSFIFWCSSCQKEVLISTDAEHQFFLESDGAFLPVFVDGNTASKTFVIFLHGGPGGSAINYNDYDLFDEIERDYAVVYWDQRCAGSAQGNCQKSSLTIAAHVRDTELLIALLKHRYGDDSSFFLMGHSWGGTLALSYLLTNNNQDYIRACIIVDGMPNFTNYHEKVTALINHHGNQQIELGKQASKWEKLLDETSSLDQHTIEGIGRLNQLTYKAESLMQQVDSISTPSLSPGKGLGVLFSSPQNLFSSLSNNLVSGNAMAEELIAFNITDELPQLSLPMAMYWGKYDFVVPLDYGQTIHEKISATEKELYVFSQSGHSPMFQEQALFNSKVKAFLKLHR